MIDKQATLFHMEQLKLSGMANAYRSSVDQPLHELPSAHEFVASLVESERMYRSAQRMQMYLKLSKLRYDAVLEQIDCSAERNLSRQQIIALSDCSFVNRAENILITGATGCGKSYLACAIGNQACSLGIRTLYLGMNVSTLPTTSCIIQLNFPPASSSRAAGLLCCWPYGRGVCPVHRPDRPGG